MTTRQPAPAPQHTLYPRKYFCESPTFHAWVKLTAAEVHALQEIGSSKRDNVYFHLNHPIRYVCVVGPIVAIEDINSHFLLLTIDDGSGRVLDLKAHRLRPESSDGANDVSTHTTVSELTVESSLGVFEVLLAAQPLTIGTVVKAKGKISEFRYTRQLSLERIAVVKSTQDEARSWQELADYHGAVLSRPWVLSEATMERVEARLKGESERKRERESRERQRVTRSMVYEKRRKKAERRFNGEPLV